MMMMKTIIMLLLIRMRDSGDMGKLLSSHAMAMVISNGNGNGDGQ